MLFIMKGRKNNVITQVLDTFENKDVLLDQGSDCYYSFSFTVIIIINVKQTF